MHVWYYNYDYELLIKCEVLDKIIDEEDWAELNLYWLDEPLGCPIHSACVFKTLEEAKKEFCEGLCEDYREEAGMTLEAFRQKQLDLYGIKMDIPYTHKEYGVDWFDINWFLDEAKCLKMHV